MFALIYDEHDPAMPLKKVISVHRSRETAEKALEKRKKKLGRTIEECYSRIVWIEGKVSAGDLVSPKSFSMYRQGERIPEGELYSDSD